MSSGSRSALKVPFGVVVMRGFASALATSTSASAFGAARTNGLPAALRQMTPPPSFRPITNQPWTTNSMMRMTRAYRPGTDYFERKAREEAIKAREAEKKAREAGTHIEPDPSLQRKPFTVDYPWHAPLQPWFWKGQHVRGKILCLALARLETLNA